ncbi:hypothetical protein ig2599ANME_2074 [groundwater metagenome]
MSEIMPPQVASIPPPSAGSEPAPRRLTYRPGTINLRSSCRNPAGSPDRNLTVLDSQTTRMPLRGIRGRALQRRNSGFPRLRTHVCPQAYVYTPSRGVTLGAFICGSYFAEAPDINYCEFIKVWASPKSSLQSHHIPPTSSSKHSTLLSERRLNAARKTKYAFLQLFNSKIDKKGDNENI